MSSGAPDEQARPGNSARAARRRQWYLATGGVAGVALLAGTGAFLITVSPAPATRSGAGNCGLVACGARLPSSVAGRAVRNTVPPAPHPHPGRRSPPPAPAAPGQAHTPKPVSAPQPPPSQAPTAPAPPRRRQPPAPRVSVAYTLDGSGQWDQGFRAHLTIVNNGHRTIAGWTIQLALPGDRVNWVGYQEPWRPFAMWQFSGTTLTLHADSGGETLSPGSTEIVPIFGDGDTTAPSGCTFNGSGCQP